MTNKLSSSFSVGAKAALAVAVATAAWAQPVWASAAPRVADSVQPSAANLSGNAFFPLVVGAKWAYHYSSGTTTSVSTETVAGSSPSATGVQVKIDSSDSLLPGKVGALTYTIGKGGTVKVQTSSGAGSSASSFASTYWIPTASEIESCSACKFSGPFSAAFSGHSMKGTLTETATALGTHTVTVPAGTFSADEVKLTIAVHATGSVPMTMTLTFHLYLAKGVGMVENSGGSMAVTTMGHSMTFQLGTDKLASYKS
jgi:hypothetical protein